MLKIWGISENDNCRFCFEEVESTVHLFWYCHEVSAFWREVQEWCSSIGLPFELDFLSIILGEVREEKNYIINIIILLGKRFIYKASNIELLNIHRFKSLVKNQFILEGFITDEQYNMERWKKFIEAEGWAGN